jgi:leucyl/phenylalanyl-tRNA--protein transferase
MIQFPDPRHSTEDGLVAYGGKMDAETLRAAYGKGIFPWPQPDLPWLWFSPTQRGVLDFSDYRVNRSNQKLFSKRTNWTVTKNTQFLSVMKACAEQVREGQAGTWIQDEMFEAYSELFSSGEALSVEVWDQERLVGGAYGVIMKCPAGRYFSGESMFHHETGASKVALHHLVKHLSQMNLSWMDTQMVTPVVESFGGKYITREEFLQRIGV